MANSKPTAHTPRAGKSLKCYLWRLYAHLRGFAQNFFKSGIKQKNCDSPRKSITTSHIRLINPDQLKAFVERYTEQIVEQALLQIEISQWIQKHNLDNTNYGTINQNSRRTH